MFESKLRFAIVNQTKLIIFGHSKTIKYIYNDTLFMLNKLVTFNIIKTLSTMKKTAIFIFVMAIAIISTAFNTSSNESEWKLYKEIQGVKIFTKVSNCQLQYTKKSNQYLIFKYENTTNKALRLSGRVDAWYSNTCRSCNLASPNEYEFSIDLQADESREGYCSDDQKAFKLFYKNTDGSIAPLDKFELSNLDVKAI